MTRSEALVKLEEWRLLINFRRLDLLRELMQLLVIEKKIVELQIILDQTPD